MVDMKTSFCGEIYQNPVSTASGTYGFGLEYGKFLPVEQLGSISTKGLTLKPKIGNKGIRILETPSGMLNAIGLENPGVEVFIKDYLPKMRERLGKAKIIANINGSTLEEYEKLAAILSDTQGISALEVNISCPNVKSGGIAFGTTCQSASEVCKVVKAVSKVPIIIKLSPNVTDIVSIAQSVENSGADAISLINTLLGMSIDIYKMKPTIGNITGGLSGNAIRPIGVRMVYQVSQKVNIPVIGMGGISTWEDAVEYFLAGASMISVGAACFKNPKAPFEIINGLKSYCENMGLKNLNEMVGLSWK